MCVKYQNLDVVHFPMATTKYEGVKLTIFKVGVLEYSMVI